MIRTGRWAVGALTILAVAAGCVTRRVHDPGPPVLIIPAGPPRSAETAADTASTPGRLPELPANVAPPVPVDRSTDVRIALATAAQEVPFSASAAWRLYDGSDGVLIRGRAGESWTIERNGRTLRARGRSGQTTAWVAGATTLRTDVAGQFVSFAGRRYRGALRVIARDTGLIVVNVVDVEDYLRGVVPLEIGVNRGPEDQAAVEAQAIAARSYTWVRLAAAVDARQTTPRADFDMVATVSDQVYGGADAEREATDRAVRTTAGLVLKFGGRIVDAPYSASCGGQTAAPEEVWRTGPSTYLRRVSDRIPGAADRYYCDIAPRFAWTREFTSAELDAAVSSYLRAYSEVPPSGPGHVRGFSVDGRTPSGRVANATFLAERGTFGVRGNDVRFVLRRPGGEILNSTYFSVSTVAARDGSLARLEIRGNGYGHGVGMCQWGAIGRARAGQSARAILAAYYPGTTVGPAAVVPR